MELFDIYRGKGVTEGGKSVAFSLTLRADDRSITAGEADEEVKTILAALETERDRVQGLIESVRETILCTERKEIMSDEKKFEALKRGALEEYRRTYETESREKYGDDKVDAMLTRLQGVTREQYQTWDSLGREILEKLSAAVAAGADPAGASGQEVADLHRRWLTVMGDKYDVRRHRGIAELYVQDERFTAYYDRERPGCARFLRDAVAHWVK